MSGQVVVVEHFSCLRKDQFSSGQARLDRVRSGQVRARPPSAAVGPGQWPLQVPVCGCRHYLTGRCGRAGNSASPGGRCGQTRYRPVIGCVLAADRAAGAVRRAGRNAVGGLVHARVGRPDGRVCAMGGPGARFVLLWNGRADTPIWTDEVKHEVAGLKRSGGPGGTGGPADQTDPAGPAGQAPLPPDRLAVTDDDTSVHTGGMAWDVFTLTINCRFQTMFRDCILRLFNNRIESFRLLTCPTALSDDSY